MRICPATGSHKAALSKICRHTEPPCIATPFGLPIRQSRAHASGRGAFGAASVVVACANCVPVPRGFRITGPVAATVCVAVDPQAPPVGSALSASAEGAAALRATDTPACTDAILRHAVRHIRPKTPLDPAPGVIEIADATAAAAPLVAG